MNWNKTSATDDDPRISCPPSVTSSSTSPELDYASIMTVRRTILLIVVFMTYCAFFFWCSYYSGTSSQSRRNINTSDPEQNQATTMDKFRSLVIAILFPGQEVMYYNGCWSLSSSIWIPCPS
jgi:hypothetical protein